MSLELHITIGISGSGKSTIADKLAREAGLIYIGSDAFRFEVSGDENNQECSKQVFELMEINTSYFLRRGQSVMVDATFLMPLRRRPYLFIARKFNAKTVAHFVNTPLHVAMARNAMRTRQVPYDVIQKQSQNLTPPQPGEFDEVCGY